jgi:hypothetical protein
MRCFLLFSGPKSFEVLREMEISECLNVSGLPYGAQVYERQVHKQAWAKGWQKQPGQRGTLVFHKVATQGTCIAHTPSTAVETEQFCSRTRTCTPQTHMHVVLAHGLEIMCTQLRSSACTVWVQVYLKHFKIGQPSLQLPCHA